MTTLCDHRGAGEHRAENGEYRVALRRFVGLVTSLTVGVCLLYWVAPVIRPFLYRDHEVIEWATALVFLAAAVVGARNLSTVGAGWRDPRWLIPGLSLLAMLDEISWGVFALGVKPPKLMGKRMDGIHDFLEVGVKWALVHVPRWVVLFGVVVITSGVLAVLVRSSRWRSALLGTAPWRFFLIAVAFGVVSQAADVAISGDRFGQALEEVLELDGALALLWSAWFLRLRAGPASIGGRGAT